MSTRSLSEKNRGVFKACPERRRSGEGRERRLAWSILKGGPFVFNTPFRKPHDKSGRSRMMLYKRSLVSFLSMLVLLILPVGAALATSNIPAKDAWKVSASSIQSDEFLPGYLADGDMATRWSSQAKDEEWALVDLGTVVEITGFTLHW